MDGEFRSTKSFLPFGMEVQKKQRKWKKRGKQIRRSEDVENGSSDSNVIEGDAIDNVDTEENLVFMTNRCSLDDSPISNHTEGNKEHFQTITDAMGTPSSSENIERTQRQTSLVLNNDDLVEQENLRRKNLISDNNQYIFLDGIATSCIKTSSNQNEKVIAELGADDVDRLYPSTSAAAEREVVELYNSNPLPRDAATYELEKFAKNVLIILNQKEFYDAPIRLGTDKDVAALTRTFEALDFVVVPYTDRTLVQIEQILAAVTNQDFSDYGCVAIAVLTHGNIDGKISAKDDTYSEMDIINCLKTHKNHSLITKPRLLFIQACRGPNSLVGVPVMRKGKTRTDLYYDTKPYTLPVEADMLVLHSSYAGNQAHRDELEGTWLIQTLCKKINQLAATHDFESILTQVKHEVAIDKEHEVANKATGENEINKQMPVVTSTLIRKLYLRKYGDDGGYATSIMNDVCANIAVDSANIGHNPESCACALDYFDYIKSCLSHYVKDNSEDTTARSLLALTDVFKNEAIFNSAKEKCAVAIANHLEQHAKHSEYFKYLHIYKRF